MKKPKETAGAWDVRREISLARPLLEQDIAELTRRLELLPGLKIFEADRGGTRMTVVYDASLLSYGVLTTALEDAGFALAPGWWNAMKIRIHDFTDSNARDNATAPPPACCNKPPKQAECQPGGQRSSILAENPER
jgi:hypothetical protein